LVALLPQTGLFLVLCSSDLVLCSSDTVLSETVLLAFPVACVTADMALALGIIKPRVGATPKTPIT